MSQDSTLKSVALYDRRAHFVQATLFRKVSIFVCLASDCTMHSSLVHPVSPFELFACFNSPFFFILSYCLGSMKECCWMILLLIFLKAFQVCAYLHGQGAWLVIFISVSPCWYQITVEKWVPSSCCLWLKVRYFLNVRWFYQLVLENKIQLAYST